MYMYNISRGQLITLWVFAVIGWHVALFDAVEVDPSPFSWPLLVAIPAALIFYTLGWKKANKKLTPGAINDVSLEKPKKTWFTSEFCLIISFILSLGSINDLSLIQSATTDEEIGFIFGSLIWIPIFILSAIFVIKKAFASDRQKVLGGKKSRQKYLAIFGVLILTLVLFAMAVGSTPTNVSQKDEEEITKNFQDALYGTDQSSDAEMSAVLRDMLQQMQVGNAIYYKNTLALDSSDVLEISSYETRNDLIRIISLIEGAMEEQKGSEQHLEKQMDQIEQSVKASTLLSDDRKVNFLKGFNEGLNDIEKGVLRRERTETLINYYESVLIYYNFLTKNFDDYIIQVDENNERNIAFYTDANITKYNALIEDIGQKSLVAMQADKKFIEYTQANFDESGINVDAEEFRNALQ